MRPCEADTLPACENFVSGRHRYCAECRVRRQRVAVRKCMRKRRRAELHAEIVADAEGLGLAPVEAPSNDVAGPRAPRAAEVHRIAAAGLDKDCCLVFDTSEDVDAHGIAHDLDLARERATFWIDEGQRFSRPLSRKEDRARQLDAEYRWCTRSKVPLLRRLLKAAERDRRERKAQSERLAEDGIPTTTPYTSFVASAAESGQSIIGNGGWTGLNEPAEVISLDELRERELRRAA